MILHTFWTTWICPCLLNSVKIKHSVLGSQASRFSQLSCLAHPSLVDALPPLWDQVTTGIWTLTHDFSWNEVFETHMIHIVVYLILQVMAHNSYTPTMHQYAYLSEYCGRVGAKIVKGRGWGFLLWYSAFCKWRGPLPRKYHSLLGSFGIPD